jgi:hypothetical protein
MQLNLLEHEVEGENIFIGGRFDSFCLHSLQFLQHYQLNSSASPSPTHLKWNAILKIRLVL